MSASSVKENLTAGSTNENVEILDTPVAVKKIGDIPQQIINFASQHKYSENSSGENNAEIFENDVKQKLLNGLNYDVRKVLKLLKSLLDHESSYFNNKLIVDIIHTLYTMFILLNSHNTVSVLIKESFAFMSIVIPFMKTRVAYHNNIGSIRNTDGDENSRFSLIENAQGILKKYSQVVLKKMEMKTKRYIETFKNISHTDEGQVTKVLLEVNNIWGQYLINNETSLCNVILLASSWKSIILLIKSFSPLFETKNSKEYDRLLLRTIETSINNCKEIFTMISKQLKEREEQYKCEGRDPSIPVSLSEKSLSSVKLLRYHQLKIKELVEVSSCRSIFLHRQIIIDHMIQSVAFVHPLYGLPHADPVTARSIQGYLHALSATTLKNLCAAVESNIASYDNKNSSDGKINSTASIFDHFKPKLLDSTGGSENREQNESLLLCFSSSMKQSYSEEEISLELSKLDILLMFIRTSKGFSQDLQLTAIKYIRWIIVYSLELYPYLVLSPKQIRTNLIKLNANNNSRWKGSYGINIGVAAAGGDDDEDVDDCYILHLCKSIRLFLSDAPKNIGAKLDYLLLEIISHSHPLCKLISKQIWPIVYGRRSSKQNIDGVIQIYKVTNILQNTTLRQNILENLGENILMLSPFEQCSVQVRSPNRRLPCRV